MNNLENDKEFKKRLEKSYKRMALVSSLWALLGSPLIFLTPDESKFFAIITWYAWVILGVLLSPKIINKIWE